jgi:hypothetical protein
MKKVLACLLFMLSAAPLLAQEAGASPGLAEVRKLGLLNGEALACKQMALVDRIRQRIIYEAPKTREVGETFENATTERFLALGKDESACTDARTMAERIEQTGQAMRAAFAGVMGQKQ